MASHSHILIYHSPVSKSPPNLAVAIAMDPFCWILSAVSGSNHFKPTGDTRLKLQVAQGTIRLQDRQQQPEESELGARGLDLEFRESHVLQEIFRWSNHHPMKIINTANPGKYQTDGKKLRRFCFLAWVFLP